MTDPITREMQVSRNDSHGNCAALALGPDALAKLPVEVDNFNTLTAYITEHGIEIASGELRDAEDITDKDSDDLPTLEDAPKELSKTQVNERYPNESPADRGPYYQRQRKRLFCMRGYECEWCDTDRANSLVAHHIEPLESFGDDELYDAHSITNMLCLCRSCHVEAHGGFGKGADEKEPPFE